MFDVDQNLIRKPRMNRWAGSLPKAVLHHFTEAINMGSKPTSKASQHQAETVATSSTITALSGPSSITCHAAVRPIRPAILCNANTLTHSNSQSAAKPDFEVARANVRAAHKA